MAEVVETIDVAVPVRTAYDRWTRFEDFPEFMDGVKEVAQLDDTHLQWVAEIAGKRELWQSVIMQQEPDQRIAWRPVGGKGPAGAVSFYPINERATRIALQMKWEPEGTLEHVGAAVGMDSRQVRDDLERFRELVEGRGRAPGWRGTVEGGTITHEDPSLQEPERPDVLPEPPTW